MTNLIFLDVDGVVIPSSMLLYDRNAYSNRTMSNTSIGVLNWLCTKADAKIVTNSTHNSQTIFGKTLKDSFIENGILETNFHQDWKTTFSISCDSKYNAIQYWLNKNHMENERWIAFDDMQFTKSHNLILIDPDDGLLLHHAKKALIKFGIKISTVLY